MRRSTSLVVLGAYVSVVLLAGCSGGSDGTSQPRQSSISASMPSATPVLPTASELTAALVTPEEVAAVMRSSTGPLAGTAWNAGEVEPGGPLSGYACSKDAADASKAILGDRTWHVQRAAWPEGPYAGRLEERLLAADPAAVETVFDAIVAALVECDESGLADGPRTISYDAVDLGSLGDESAAFVTSVAGEPGGSYHVVLRDGSVLVEIAAVSWSDLPDNDLPTREPVLFTQDDVTALATMAVSTLR